MNKKKRTKYQHFHIKRDDIVKVITGNNKNETGKILKIDTKNRRAVVEGINIRIYHIKPTQRSKGRREKREGSIHISNLKLIDSTKRKIIRTGKKK